MTKPTILTICGSLRAGSVNRKLLAEAVALFGPATVIKADLRLPLYDGDLEDAQGIPGAVLALADQIRQADGIILSSPEYNKGITGVLKNALDWVSRVEGMVLKDKPLAVMSANDGRAGGETGQYMLRACLTPLRPRIINGPFVMVAGAAKVFESGRLDSPHYLKTLGLLMDALRAEIARD
ncbi:NAD(P)H-dependent oxidoreductase [Thalassovita sp.]|uniref:NADPH-dependent FMN reductase n=1 Tax=Thalassovita sp. TaxID=1979401 RepID=UPI0029DE86A4|nr:NAD(P)H-dependent oxidoreductase [Thalassovita sp.]